MVLCQNFNCYGPSIQGWTCKCWLSLSQIATDALWRRKWSGIVKRCWKVLLVSDALPDIKLACPEGQMMKSRGNGSPIPTPFYLQIIRRAALLLCICLVWVVWSWRSSAWSVLSAESCWMYHLEHLKNKDVGGGGSTTTGSECHKGRRGIRGEEREAFSLTHLSLNKLPLCLRL